jgi:Phosphotransferase enzyme family
MSDNTVDTYREKAPTEGEGWLMGSQDKGKSLSGPPRSNLLPGEEEGSVPCSPEIYMGDISQEFSVFMDTAKMKALFQQELPDCLSGHWTLTDCQIQHPRYKTYLNPKSHNKSFLALAYHLKGINGQTHKADDRILYAKVFLGSRSHSEYLKACAEAHPAQQDAMLHIAKLGMVAWFFPYDPALPWLSKVLDKEFARKYFADFLLLQKNAPSCVIKAIALNIINYRPEIRCTYRYDLKRLSGTTQTLYGKTFADGGGSEIHRRIVHLYPRTENNPESFVMPRLLGYDYTLHTLWLEGLEGKSLVDLINVQNADQLMVSVARHLCDFHKAEISGLEVITEGDQLTEIQKKSAKLQSAFPGLAKRIEALEKNLNQQKQQLQQMPNRLSHGDFHIQQLLLLPDHRIALFDFDELALSNPLLDVANFCADLYTLALGNDLVEYLINRLFNAYKTFSDANISDGHFIWHFKVQLLTRAYRAYIQQKPNLESVVKQLIDAAEIGYAFKNSSDFIIQ